jgi:methionine-rich copper-binding protein CopC
MWTIRGLLLLLVTHCVNAHAILLSATPAERQVFSGSEVPVKLRFNSRIDGKRSRLLLIAPDGTQNVLQIGEQTSPDTVTSQAKGLKSGSYVIRWQVLANDGHITRGEVPFRVQ